MQALSLKISMDIMVNHTTQEAFGCASEGVHLIIATSSHD